MKKFNHFLVFTAILIASLHASSMYPFDPENPETIHPDAKTFSIELLSNPTTGYQWKIISMSEGITVSQKVYMPPDQPCCGAPGVEQLDVVLTDDFSGKGEIVMAYIRPWEQDSEDQATPVIIEIEK